jgi:hypothetical protein
MGDSCSTSSISKSKKVGLWQPSEDSLGGRPIKSSSVMDNATEAMRSAQTE